MSFPDLIGESRRRPHENGELLDCPVKPDNDKELKTAIVAYSSRCYDINPLGLKNDRTLPSLHYLKRKNDKIQP